jgi:hypothetical protein
MMKQGDSNPSSAFIGRGPQNNMEGLLVSVSEFEPWAVFQGCACASFSLYHLSEKLQENRFIGFNAESRVQYIATHFRILK